MSHGQPATYIISAREDKTEADRLKADLRARGVDISDTFDLSQRPPQHFLVLISVHTVQSDFVLKTLEALSDAHLSAVAVWITPLEFRLRPMGLRQHEPIIAYAEYYAGAVAKIAALLSDQSEAEDTFSRLSDTEDDSSSMAGRYGMPADSPAPRALPIIAPLPPPAAAAPAPAPIANPSRKRPEPSFGAMPSMPQPISNTPGGSPVASGRSAERDSGTRSLSGGGGMTADKGPLLKKEASADELQPESVYFTAYRPDAVPVAQWLTLLVYAHTEQARALISTDADKFSERMGGKPKAVQGKAAASLERGTELRLVPTCDGVQFNPESITLKWVEDWHRAEFRFQADAALNGTEDIARVSIYVGPLLVGQIKLALSFIAEAPPAAPTLVSVITGRGRTKAARKRQPVSARMYDARQIFLSYSHADSDIVLACRDACKRLGFIPLIDIDTLRSGQHWNAELMALIEKADIFQLFWSERAAQSKYVQQEWEYALQLVQQQSKSADFIRPTYWQKPLAPVPEALADLHFDYTPPAPVVP